MSSVTIVSSLDFNSAVFTQFFLLIEGFFLSNIWGFFLLFGAFCVIGLFFRFIYKV